MYLGELSRDDNFERMFRFSEKRNTSARGSGAKRRLEKQSTVFYLIPTPPATRAQPGLFSEEENPKTRIHRRPIRTARQRGRHRGGARELAPRQSLLGPQPEPIARPDPEIAGVPASVTSADLARRLQRFDDLTAGALMRVLVVADTAVCEIQNGRDRCSGAARVFASDDVDAFQGFERAKRNVLQGFLSEWRR